MAKLVPGRQYTKEELAQLRDDPELAGYVLKGYVFRAELNGKYSFVPWHKAMHGAERPGKSSSVTEGGMRDKKLFVAETEGTPLDRKSLPPLTKRTPHQRVKSLISKMGEDLKAGRVLSEEQIREITAEAWRTGTPEISGEVVRLVAQRYLEKAEKEFEAAEDKRVTRTSGSLYA